MNDVWNEPRSRIDQGIWRSSRRRVNDGFNDHEKWCEGVRKSNSSRWYRCTTCRIRKPEKMHLIIFIFFLWYALSAMFRWTTWTQAADSLNKRNIRHTISLNALRVTKRLSNSITRNSWGLKISQGRNLISKWFLFLINFSSFIFSLCTIQKSFFLYTVDSFRSIVWFSYCLHRLSVGYRRSSFLSL